MNTNCCEKCKGGIYGGLDCCDCPCHKSAEKPCPCNRYGKCCGLHVSATDTTEKEYAPHGKISHDLDADGVPVYDVLCKVCTSPTTDTNDVTDEELDSAITLLPKEDTSDWRVRYAFQFLDYFHKDHKDGGIDPVYTQLLVFIEKELERAREEVRHLMYSDEEVQNREDIAVAEHDAKWHPIVGTTMKNTHDFEKGRAAERARVLGMIDGMVIHGHSNDKLRQGWEGYNESLNDLKDSITKLTEKV